MLKLLLLFFLFFVTLYGADKVEIYASSLDSKGDIVEASGGITLVYKDYMLSADEAIYNRASGDLELFDNIRLNQGNSYKVLGKYAKLNIAKKERTFKPFFFMDKESEVWISGKEGYTQDKDINLEGGVISGCNPVDPLWKMQFSSSDYNSQSKWLNIYNARLYLGDIPVLYSPYFGYSLDTTRRSGLLMPSFGLSDQEGLFYEQPIYIAPQNWWDMELKPQLRTNRGKGIYQTFRFVDSKTSRGEFNAGYFKEDSTYFINNNLQNQSHYGFNFLYSNQNFINQWFGTHLQGQSGLYVDANSMNDVDYINLSSSDTQNNTTATQVLSRLNTFYNTQNNYIGAYFKYYVDLTSDSNDQTLQKLPTLQYHYYLDTFLKDHLLYSLDLQSNNIQRKEGKTVVQTNINLPITLRTSFFDEYLNVAYSANIYFQHSKFGSLETNTSLGLNYKDGYILRNSHTLSASTELTRAYENLSHVISFGVSYNNKGSQKETGFYEENSDFCSQAENVNTLRCEFYNISKIKNQTQLDFNQYIYNKEGDEILYHRLSQNISYSNLSRYGELENELDYKVTKNISYYNNMFYNYDKNQFSKIFNRISINEYGLNLSVSHLYKDSFIDSTSSSSRYTSYLTSSAIYTYNDHYSYSGAYNYDLDTQELKNMEIGFLYKQKCWDFGIKYSENNRPVLLQGDLSSSVYDRYIYLTIALKPLMRSDGSSLVNYRLPSDN